MSCLVHKNKQTFVFSGDEEFLLFFSQKYRFLIEIDVKHGRLMCLFTWLLVINITVFHERVGRSTG